MSKKLSNSQLEAKAFAQIAAKYPPVCLDNGNMAIELTKMTESERTVVLGAKWSFGHSVQNNRLVRTTNV